MHVLPGSTPLLLARPDLVNYGSKTVKVSGVPVKPSFTKNGHYMINIFDDLQDVMSIEELQDKTDHFEDDQTFIASMLTDDTSDFEQDIEVDMDAHWADEHIYLAAEKAQRTERKLKFWELYVDEGRLGAYLASKYDDVETRVFTLPHWDFEYEERRNDFFRLLEREEPHHCMVTPACRIWSPMQNMNYRPPEEKRALQALRDYEEDEYLAFYAKIHATGKRLRYDSTLPLSLG